MMQLAMHDNGPFWCTVLQTIRTVATGTPTRIPGRKSRLDTFRNKGRRRFQIDLSLELGAYAIQRDWDGDLDNESGKPAWMRQGRLMPCGCGGCFFCVKGWTNGIDHKTVTKQSPAHQVPAQCSDQRSKIRTACQQCSVCYAIHSAQYTGTLRGRARQSTIIALCSKTRKGCATFNNVVCESHWSHELAHKPVNK